MSVEPSYPGGTKAHWNDKETEALLDHLIEKKTLGQGNGNFKDQVFTSAAEAISSLLSSGPVKTSKNCKTKWTTVRVFIFFPYHIYWLSLLISWKAFIPLLKIFNPMSLVHIGMQLRVRPLRDPRRRRSGMISSKPEYATNLISLDLSHANHAISPTLVIYETLQRSRLVILW